MANSTSTEHHIRIEKTARYLTRGNTAGARQVWFVCHGYRQLASRFISYFSAIDDGSTYIVAPEALSRFYLGDDQGPHGPDADIGASWMTREDRLHEIADYVGYLDALHDRVFQEVRRSDVVFRVLGFSQGVDTVCRWIGQGRARPDHLILWGGLVPADVDLSVRPFDPARLTLVVGDHDLVIPPSRVVDLEERLQGY
jgi:predicted esterase